MSKQENETIIELKSVSKFYGLGDAESKALNKFDLTVKRGEFIMIMGPSGCGKTTLLNIIGLLDKPTEGDYYLHGKQASKISARKKAHFRAKEIGFIFQNFNLIPTLSVIENVSLPLIYNGISKTRRLKQADNILEHFHLQKREYYMPYQLSGGQQQRVAIARSLITKPSIILADEPTGNLDSRSSHIIMEELRDIHSQGNTIIMVTHNPDLTAYATRVINMLDGSIDTDIKTVADHDLPTGNIVPEKISVRVLSRQKPPEINVESETKVVVSGNNIAVHKEEAAEKDEKKEEKKEDKPRTLKKRELHNSPYTAKPATAKDAPKPDEKDNEKKSEQKPRKRRAVVKLSSLTKKLTSIKKSSKAKKEDKAQKDKKKAKKGKDNQKMALMINTNFRLAKESLRRNRGRTFLSALGIAIGVASIVLILSLTGGINRLISTNDDKNNANLILVRPNNNRDIAKNIVEELSDGNKYAKSNLTLEDVDEIKKIDNVSKVAPIAISSASIIANEKTHGPFNVLASNPDLPEVVNLPLYKGEHFTADSQPNAAVIGYDAAMTIYGGPDAITKTFIYNNQRFIIIGVLEKIEEPINYNGTDFDNTILINVGFAKTFESALQIQQINVRTATTGEVKETAERINGLLADRKKGTETYQVITGSEDLHPVGSLLSIVSAMLTIVAGISIVVGGVGIMNIMLVSVSERTREIGIRKALGATAGNILSQFLFESTILSISGGIMGFALGYLGAFLIQLVTPFAPHISWQIIGITAAVSLTTGIIFGIYPAIKAASKDPIVSLKFYR